MGRYRYTQRRSNTNSLKTKTWNQNWLPFWASLDVIHNMMTCTKFKKIYILHYYISVDAHLTVYYYLLSLVAVFFPITGSSSLRENLFFRHSRRAIHRPMNLSIGNPQNDCKYKTATFHNIKSS